MKIAYILFDDITLLDFIGIYDPIKYLKSKNYLPGINWDLCALSPSIKDSFGLEVKVTKLRPDLSHYDMIIVPGGYGTRKLQFDVNFISWLKTGKGAKFIVSICTGSLLLGAAGFLRQRLATTNFNEYEALEPYCQRVIKKRIVEDGNIITAGAVASSLDVGLYICEKLVGKEHKEIIRIGMDYHPLPFEVFKANVTE